MGLQTGMTPLHKACQYGHVRAVEELIKEGADVLAVNNVRAFTTRIVEPQDIETPSKILICRVLPAVYRHLQQNTPSKDLSTVCLCEVPGRVFSGSVLMRLARSGMRHLCTGWSKAAYTIRR